MWTATVGRQQPPGTAAVRHYRDETAPSVPRLRDRLAELLPRRFGSEPQFAWIGRPRFLRLQARSSSRHMPRPDLDLSRCPLCMRGFGEVLGPSCSIGRSGPPEGETLQGGLLRMVPDLETARDWARPFSGERANRPDLQRNARPRHATGDRPGCKTSGLPRCQGATDSARTDHALTGEAGPHLHAPPTLKAGYDPERAEAADGIAVCTEADEPRTRMYLRRPCRNDAAESLHRPMPSLPRSREKAFQLVVLRTFPALRSPARQW